MRSISAKWSWQNPLSDQIIFSDLRQSGEKSEPIHLVLAHVSSFTMRIDAALWAIVGAA